MDLSAATLQDVSAYFVVNCRITDPDLLAEYRAVVGASFAGHDVEVLAASSDAAVVEGDPIGTRVVLLRFPSRDAAMAWYHSDAYQQVVGLRLAATEGSALLVDGLA